MKIFDALKYYRVLALLLVIAFNIARMKITDKQKKENKISIIS